VNASTMSIMIRGIRPQSIFIRMTNISQMTPDVVYRNLLWLIATNQVAVSEKTRKIIGDFTDLRNWIVLATEQREFTLFPTPYWNTGISFPAFAECATLIREMLVVTSMTETRDGYRGFLTVHRPVEVGAYSFSWRRSDKTTIIDPFDKEARRPIYNPSEAIQFINITISQIEAQV